VHRAIAVREGHRPPARRIKNNPTLKGPEDTFRAYKSRGGGGVSRFRTATFSRGPKKKWAEQYEEVTFTEKQEYANSPDDNREWGGKGRGGRTSTPEGQQGTAGVDWRGPS